MVYHDPLHIGWDQLTVEYNGQEIFILNKLLLDQQNAWTNLEDIKETHWLKLMFYEMIMETDNRTELAELAKDIQSCEFELQRLWGFSEDARFHRFWETPKCECPRLDNEERYGTSYLITNQSCPLHGE
jgi:hypothetical protein